MKQRLAADAHPSEQAPPRVGPHPRPVHLRPRGLVLVQRRGEEAERLRRHEELVVEARHAVAPRRAPLGRRGAVQQVLRQLQLARHRCFFTLVFHIYRRAPFAPPQLMAERQLQFLLCQLESRAASEFRYADEPCVS